MTPQEYQSEIRELTTQFKIIISNQLPTYTAGLFEECGEVAGLIKRLYRGDLNPSNLEEANAFIQDMTLELGDALGYLTLLCEYFGISLETVMVENLKKIERRLENGTTLGTGGDR